MHKVETNNQNKQKTKPQEVMLQDPAMGSSEFGFMVNIEMTWACKETGKEADQAFFPIHYGLGIFKMETPWGEAYFHSGDAIGYYACMVYFPDRETTISWAVNGNYGKIDEFTSTQSAMEEIFGTVFN